jgi:hypothetical protein
LQKVSVADEHLDENPENDRDRMKILRNILNNRLD